MHTTVMKKGPTRFNMVGQHLDYELFTIDESISAGLAKRLVSYALSRLNDAGFVVDQWNIEVYTMDGDVSPVERRYCVKFQNEKGGYIELIGIYTEHGWPSLDHGFSIGID